MASNPGSDVTREGDTDLVEPINFLKVFAVLRRHPLWIAGPAILFTLAAFMFAAQLKNYYVSTARILVDPEGARVVEGEISGGTRATEAHALNQQFIITSVKVLSPVVEAEGLVDDEEFGASLPYEADREKRVQRALDALQNVTSADLNKASFVIDLSVTANDAVKAARIANAIAASYTQTRVEMNTGLLRRATDDLSAQLASLEMKVEEGDRAVQNYKATHNLVDVDGRPTVEQQITAANTEISRISASVAENEALVSELRLARSDREYLRSTPDIYLTPAIIALRTRYQEVQEQQDVLASTLGSRHPSFLSAQTRTRSVSALLDDQLRNFATSVGRNTEKLKNQRDLLQKNLTALRTNMNTGDQSMVRLRELERKLASDRLVYEAFLLRTRQLSGQEQTINENPQIISIAQEPLRKAGPKRSLIIAGAAIFGLIFGAGLALLREQYGPENRSGNRAASETPAPVTPARDIPGEPPVRPRPKGSGLLARLMALLRNKAALLSRRREPPRNLETASTASFMQDTTKEIAPALAAPDEDEDAYIDIARNLVLDGRWKNNYCVALFSAQTDDHSANAAFNIAHAAAKLGKRVLLVDAAPDAALTAAADAGTRPGLLNAISTRRIEKDFLDRPGIASLWFMPAGRRTPRFATRRSEKTETLIDWLEASGNDFDLVITDAGRAEGQHIAPEIELAVDKIVVLQQRSDKSGLENAMDLLRQRGLSPVDIIAIPVEHGPVAARVTPGR